MAGQGLLRPPESASARRAPRRHGALFQMTGNGLLLHADNSDLSYKAILVRLTGAGTYGLALERLARAPLGAARDVLAGAALLRLLQEALIALAAVPEPLRPPRAARATEELGRALAFLAPLVGGPPPERRSP